jgi:membrane protein
MSAASQSSAAIGQRRQGAAAIGHGRRAGGYVREALALGFRLKPVDRALALSSKLFVAVIPLTITVSALVPGTDSFGSSLVRVFHLSGAGARATQALFATDRGTLGAVGLLGIVIVLYSVLSYARGLQRLYLDAWGLAPLGAEGWWRRVLWSGGYTTYLALWALLQTRDHRARLAVTYAPLVVALSVAVAFWGPWALIGSRIPWPRLLPTAALTAAADAVFKALSVLFVPPAFTAAAHRYGLIGIAFTLLSWLFLEALVCVMAAIVTVNRDRRRHGPAITPGQADSDRCASAAR